ncbi:Type IV fimbrial biogenesis protein FimT [hydrothermal vent metagenome]|uniref:Type IV fimbrial biogenesis protein FimT n=1 Tax=hydrothermal vent metagenome TaxID=652676 RepID=A0A3B0YEX3_9ZZZZ
MKTQTGFTLVELMIALAVFAITVTFAIPNLREFIQNNRLISQTNDMSSSLHLARSEAVKRKQTVTICGSNNSSTCNTPAWEQGWIVFVDVDGDGVVDGGTDEILRVSGALSGANTLRTISFTSTARVQYNSQGAIDSTGSFTLCDTRGALTARAININITGRARQASDDTNSTIVNDVDGSDVTCP